MLTRRSFALTFAGAGAACLAPLLAGCAGPVHSLRYKLALDVETPEGLKTGASVVQLSVRHITAIDVGGSFPREIRGEAVAVDLGQRGLLFALLSADGDRKTSKSAEKIAQAALGFKGGNETLLPWIDSAQAAKLKAAVPAELLPMLVRFRDIADPKSVERVDPNNLAAAFGPGVTLKRATLEITDEPITTGIEKRLGWMAWSSSKWIEFASDGFEPMRIRNSNGTVTSIPRPEFKRGN